MHQSTPGVRRRRVSQPSIHLPRLVKRSATKIGGSALSRLSASAKNSSLRPTTAAPSRSSESTGSVVKSIAMAPMMPVIGGRAADSLALRSRGCRNAW